jgi:RNA polymerase sigma-70 factor (ECF subfamily)
VDSDHTPRRLSSITTLWSVLREAHEGKGEAATAAQELLMRRYGEAVRRYLLAVVRDPHAADELTQEFALALVRGSFRAADPQRGRFRDYVKTVLYHLVVSKYREAQKQPRAVLPPNSPALANLAAPAPDADQAFDQACREDLLARAWDALADAHPTFYAVLRFKAEHAQMPYAEVAAQLGRQLGKPLTADGVRQAMHRARELYADLLVEEVARSLESPTLERVTEELGDLNLLTYCQPALDRYSRQRKGS